MSQESPHLDDRIANLKELASWYRSWADLAGTESDRQARLRLADKFDAQVAALIGGRR